MTPRFDPVVRGLAAVAAVAALAVFPGCSETPGRSPDAAAPASIDDAALPVDGASTEDRGAEPDAGPPALAACTCDPDETCTACVENLATCCYGDPELSGQAALLAATCEAAAPCRACCDECAAASCETLRATGSCPNLAPNEPFPVSSTNGGLLNGGPLSEFHTKPLATNADLATALKDAPGFVPRTRRATDRFPRQRGPGARVAGAGV